MEVKVTGLETLHLPSIQNTQQLSGWGLQNTKKFRLDGCDTGNVADFLNAFKVQKCLVHLSTNKHQLFVLVDNIGNVLDERWMLSIASVGRENAGWTHDQWIEV